MKIFPCGDVSTDRKVKYRILETVSITKRKVNCSSSGKILVTMNDDRPETMDTSEKMVMEGPRLTLNSGMLNQFLLLVI